MENEQERKGMDPAVRETLDARARQRRREQADEGAAQEGGAPDDEFDEMLDMEGVPSGAPLEGKEYVAPSEVFVTRDENGDRVPIDAPLIDERDEQSRILGDPMNKKVSVLPFFLPEQRAYTIRLDKFEARMEKDEGEPGAVTSKANGLYQFNADGHFCGYDTIPLKLIVDLVNDHLVRPDIHVDGPRELENEVASEWMLGALFSTIWTYGTGVDLRPSAREEDSNEPTPKRDKKK